MQISITPKKMEFDFFFFFFSIKRYGRIKLKHHNFLLCDGDIVFAVGI